MRKNLTMKTTLYPMPVLIVASYDKNGNPNAMNAGWGGISGYDEITLGLAREHKTVENILERKAFTVSMGELEYLKSCDYVGIVSASKEADKMKKSGFTTTKSEFVDAPLINELSISMECRLKSYDPKTGHMIGQIVNAGVDERILTDGKVDLSKVHVLTLDPLNYTYHVMSEPVGRAFKDGAKLK